MSTILTTVEWIPMFSHYALCHLRRNVEPRYKVHAYEAACRCMCIEREKNKQKQGWDLIEPAAGIVSSDMGEMDRWS